MIKRTSERKKLESKLDSVVSQVVRYRDEWTCSRCNKKYTPPTSSLHCSHYFPRQKRGTRWILENLDAVCMPCHFYHWESEKQSDYREFKLKQLGKQGYDLLEYKANSLIKYSNADIEFMIKEFQGLLKDYKNKYELN